MKKNLKKFIAFTVLTLAVILITQTTVFAGNTSNQSATTAKSTSLAVVDKVGTSAITTVTFPSGQPNDAIDDPSNDVNTSDPQVVSATISEPVVRINNTTGGTLKIWLEIASWSGGVAASEHYNVAAGGATDINAVTNVLSADGTAASVDTTIQITDSTFKDLYLKLTLSASAGKTGSSMLTVLGETP